MNAKLTEADLEELRHVALIAHSNGHDGIALDITQDRVIAAVKRIIARVARTEKPRAEGVEYTKANVEEIRTLIINDRNTALADADFTRAVYLSWVIAYLSEYAEVVERL